MKSPRGVDFRMAWLTFTQVLVQQATGKRQTLPVCFSQCSIGSKTEKRAVDSHQKYPDATD